jgi:hypothetical protein
LAEFRQFETALAMWRDEIFADFAKRPGRKF